MNKQIFISKYGTGPDVDKLTSKHFELDLAYAYTEGYTYIGSELTDQVFLIIDEHTIEECYPERIEEEELSDEEYDACDKLTDDEEYCIHCHNLMLIDQVINNTLSQKDPITPQQAETMLKLATLSQFLQGGN